MEDDKFINYMYDLIATEDKNGLTEHGLIYRSILIKYLQFKHEEVQKITEEVVDMVMKKMSLPWILPPVNPMPTLPSYNPLTVPYGPNTAPYDPAPWPIITCQNKESLTELKGV
jgi:hypothetical protein